MSGKILVLRRRPVVMACGLAFVVAGIWPFWRQPAPPPPPPKRPVVLDPGHGGIDGGATYGGVSEKGINLDIALRTAALLQNRGLPVVLTRRGDEHLSLESYRQDLRARLDMARAAGAWAMVAIHANASSSADAKGTLVLFQRHEPRSRQLAVALRQALKALRPDQPHKADMEYDHYYFDNSPVPTVAVEVGYLTHPADRTALLRAEYRQALAEAIAGALEKVWDDIEPPAPTPPNAFDKK